MLAAIIAAWGAVAGADPSPAPEPLTYKKVPLREGSLYNLTVDDARSRIAYLSGTIAVRDCATFKLTEYQFKDRPFMPFLTADGSKLIVTHPNVRVIDTATGKQLAAQEFDWYVVKPTQDRPAVCMPAFARSRLLLYLGGPSNHVTVWDVATGKEACKPYETGTRPRSLSLSDDQKELAIAVEDGVEVWDTEKHVRVKAITLPKLKRSPAPLPAIKPPDEFFRFGGSDSRSVYFTPDRKQLYVIHRRYDAEADTLIVIDTATGKAVHNNEQFHKGMDTVTFLPRQKTAVFTTRFDNVPASPLLDMESFTPLDTNKLLIPMNLTPLAYCPGSKEYVAGGRSRTLIVIKEDDLDQFVRQVRKRLDK